MKKHQIRVEQISYRYPLYQDTQEGLQPEQTDSSPGIDRDTKKQDHPYGNKTESITESKTASGMNTDEEPNALDHVDLEVEEGQFICILGSNGSGKSTLARHLNALLIPDEGTVWIGGMNTSDESLIWEIRSQVGMVFQNPDNQMVTSRVDEEVAFGLENMGVPSEEIVRQVSAALKQVGMDGYAWENPYNLSGGQKQRVAVAGILAMKPKCIVMDESTAMLDPRGRADIMNTVLKLNREHGITLICITHYMEEAVEADRIFVMYKGKILTSGTPRDVFSRPQILETAGLKLPVICQLAQELRDRGMEIPPDLITAEELKAFLEQSEICPAQRSVRKKQTNDQKSGYGNPLSPKGSTSDRLFCSK